MVVNCKRWCITTVRYILHSTTGSTQLMRGLQETDLKKLCVRMFFDNSVSEIFPERQPVWNVSVHVGCVMRVCVSTAVYHSEVNTQQ